MSDITGGWSPFTCNISAEEMAVFKKVTGMLVGVEYSPVAVSTQVVSGVNYDFFCNAKGLYPGAANESAMMRVYAPATGEPHIVSIERIEH